MNRLPAVLLLLGLLTGCAVDPCQRVEDRMRRLGGDLLANPALLDPNAPGRDADAAELRAVAVDAIRYNCLARY
jgi:hypothetical protein